MAMHLSGKDFDIMVGGILIHVLSASLKITDNRKVKYVKGVPVGFFDGDVAADGELELDAQNFGLLSVAAATAGSWKDLGTMDIAFVGVAQASAKSVEAFDCLLTISDLVSVDPKGGDDDKTKLPFMVTGSDFVRINGVPYLSTNDTLTLLG